MTHINKGRRKEMTDILGAIILFLFLMLLLFLFSLPPEKKVVEKK
jgi:hypothetical protein